MSNNTQRTQELLAQEGLESIGQKLFVTIYNDLSGNPKTARRWIWELLQNAKDVISQDGIIEINLNDTSVEFGHNGGPFLHSHLLAILSQRSTKSPNYTDDEKQAFFDRLFSDEGIDGKEAKLFLDTTGKFGTGFMTTYLLSKEISLESIYSTNGSVKSFRIPLDRKAATPDEMKEKVKTSFSSFTELEQSKPTDEIINDYVEGSKCYTKFIYEFDSEGKIVAQHGISDLHNSIAFTFSFVEKLKSIKLVEFGKYTTYTRLEPRNIDNVNIVRIEKESHLGKEILEIAKLSEKHDALTIAIQVKHIDGNKYEICSPSDGTARQFISFPLIGSERFSFPVIINSPLFNLEDNTRSQVCLNLTQGKDFDKKVLLNRALFQKAIGLFKQLLAFACKNNWENLYQLAKSDLPKDIDESWYKEFVQKELRKEILESEIVVTENNIKRIRPKDAKFPVKETRLEEFWDLCKYVIGDKIPRKSDVEIWKTIVVSDSNSWLGIDFDFTLEKLLEEIQAEKTFFSFNNKYFKDEESAFKALNEVIRFTEDEDKELLNRKEKPLFIFPNQADLSPFVEKRALSRDVKIPFQIKNVLKCIGENWYEKLVRDEITVFERENRLTIKDASDKIKDKIEKYYSGKLKEDEAQLLNAGMFGLLNYSAPENKIEIEALHKFTKALFPDKIGDTVQELNGLVEFDWIPCKVWALKAILKKVSDFGNLNKLSMHLFNLNYPVIKEKYSEVEQSLMFKVDYFLNGLIQYTLSFDRNLLTEFAIIPNQLNDLSRFNKEIFNDVHIPAELKVILKDFGTDCKKNLLHSGVSIELNGARDLKWICGELDDIVIKEQHNDELKQPIRELDKWISRNKNSISGMDELFKSFYRKRSGIVLNTYGLEERNQFDEILKSGMSAEFADIVKSGAKPETIKEIVQLSKEVNLDIALAILKKHPNITSKKIEEWMELEELSKGWDPELKYDPNDEQIKLNFESGWKGEAFVYKELKKKGIEIEWPNKSNNETGYLIVDFENEQHFIHDKGHKYDLVAKSQNRVVYIQVKATTTDISRADAIALPISTREWKFILETVENESYYLARVFNVNSNPELYFMKLETPGMF